MVTVKLTRGQIEALVASAQHTRELLSENAHTEEAEWMVTTIACVRAQIGGAR